MPLMATMRPARSRAAVSAMGSPSMGRHAGSNELYVRAAVRASGGLSVEAPVGRVVVFALAGRTQVEDPHGGVGSVVRDGLDDRVAGAAVRAVDEGVAMATVGAVAQFGETVLADRSVGRDLGILIGVACDWLGYGVRSLRESLWVGHRARRCQPGEAARFGAGSQRWRCWRGRLPLRSRRRGCCWQRSRPGCIAGRGGMRRVGTRRLVPGRARCNGCAPV